MGFEPMTSSLKGIARLLEFLDPAEHKSARV